MPQLVPAGLGVAVPVAPAMPVVETNKLKLVMSAPHDVPSQVAVPFVGTGQATHELPQLATLLLDTHSPPQLWKPVLHAMPQLVPLQVALPLAGTGQAVHDGPQLCALLFAAQLLPHAWKPVPHWNPHCRPSQIALPFAGATQAVHDVVPQLATPELATQALPHR